MKKDESGPRSVFGIRVKTVAIFLIFSAVLLVAINHSEIESLLDKSGIDKSLSLPGRTDSIDQQKQENHIVVDQKMLDEAIKEVQLEQLSKIESGDGATPTDRFFYIIELHGGSDLEGVDLVIDPDYVSIVSEGGTKTTIARTTVKEIKRFRLPPSQDN